MVQGINLITSDLKINSRLRSNEKQTIHFKLVRAQTGEFDAAKSPEFLTSLGLEKVVLMEDQIQVDKSIVNLDLARIADSDFQYGFGETFESFLKSYRTSCRIEILQNQYTTFSKDQILKMFKLYWSDDLDLIVFFS